MLAKLVSPGQNGFARLQYVAGSVYVAVNALRARVGVIFQDFVRYQLSVGEKSRPTPQGAWVGEADESLQSRVSVCSDAWGKHRKTACVKRLGDALCRLIESTSPVLCASSCPCPSWAFAAAV